MKIYASSALSNEKLSAIPGFGESPYEVTSEKNINVNAVLKSREFLYKVISKNINDDTMFICVWRLWKNNVQYKQWRKLYWLYLQRGTQWLYSAYCIYTQEEDNAMMREFNDETIFVLTPKSNGSMKETMQQDIAPGCRYGEHRNNGSTKVLVCFQEQNQIYQNKNK